MIREKLIELYDNYQTASYGRVIRAERIKACCQNGIDPYAKAPGEAEYLSFWRGLVKKDVEPFSFRLFSRYMEPSMNIVPTPVEHYLIERYLNPSRYISCYDDKNLYCCFFKKGIYPETILARIDGSALLDGEYRYVEKLSKEISSISASELSGYMAPYKKICLKPSIDTDSGRGVEFFERNSAGEFANKRGDLLDGSKLAKYLQNFVIQEVLDQHPFFAQFNNTSVNTLRLYTYRSVITEEVKVTAAALRIGRRGESVDNIHAGGHFVGIDIKTGQLQNHVLNGIGNSFEVFNGIDFGKTDFVVPEWNKILEFAKELALQNHHIRILGLDLSLSPDGQPKMVEINHGGISFWIPMFCGMDIFDGEIKEVVEYCLARQQVKSKHLRIIDI